MTQGDKLYLAMQNDSIVLGIAKMIEQKKVAKHNAKMASHAKYLEAVKSHPVKVNPELFIAPDATQYSHARYGVGFFVREDDNTITLSFNGQVKILVKAFNIITKL